MDNERELGWNDEISNDGNEFVLLPPGDYDFTVTDFVRGRHNGSDKLPPCNKAELSLYIQSDKGNVTIKHNLFLHTKTEGMLSAFFCAIGQKKHGEPCKPNWDKVRGSRGRCKIGIREWENKSGEKMQSNEIKRFYDYEPPAPRAFTPGSF